MKVDIETLKKAHDDNHLIQGNWGDGKDTFCMMSALVPNATRIADCVAAGWPDWLVDLNIALYDSCDSLDDAYGFAFAIATACDGKDIPETVAMEHCARCLDRCLGYIGDGDEKWHVVCRTVVTNAMKILREDQRWLNETEIARAANAASAAAADAAAADAAAADADAARAAVAAWAAWAANAANAARAADAAWAANAANAAARAANAAESAERDLQRADLIEILSRLPEQEQGHE